MNSKSKTPRHLPASIDEAKKRKWKQVDVVLVTGDAHVDHPSFPAAVLGRTLEAEGFSIGIIARPDVNDPKSISVFGKPRLFFGVTSGSLDSMVANLTALKKRRRDDPFAPGGKAGGRPDRALTVYCNLIRREFGKSTTIVAGGIEASLRRFAHYDYWSDSIRRPILMDCGADVAVHGMGEGPVVDIAKRLADLQGKEAPAREALIDALATVPGLIYRVAKSKPEPHKGVALPDCEAVVAAGKTYVEAHRLVEQNRNARVWQQCGGMRVIANPPWTPSSEDLDKIFTLPFTRDIHPIYKGQRVPALDQVRFSVTTHRGCCGGCAFCAIGTHQGKTIIRRSEQSVLDEVDRIVKHKEFRGTIRDLGGPTANMYGTRCKKKLRCERPSCLWPKRCKHLSSGQARYLTLLRKVKEVDGVKHLFVSTGIRTDLAVDSNELIQQIAQHHTSGRIKVAPEHVSEKTLHAMRKPNTESFLEFTKQFRKHSKAVDKKQFLLPYMMAAHPGSGIKDMEEVRAFLRDNRLVVEQCQIFTPTPGTAATVMYATKLDLKTKKKIFVEKDATKKQLQKDKILADRALKKGQAMRKSHSKPYKR